MLRFVNIFLSLISTGIWLYVLTFVPNDINYKHLPDVYLVMNVCGLAFIVSTVMACAEILPRDKLFFYISIALTFSTFATSWIVVAIANYRNLWPSKVSLIYGYVPGGLFIAVTVLRIVYVGLVKDGTDCMFLQMNVFPV